MEECCFSKVTGYQPETLLKVTVHRWCFWCFEMKAMVLNCETHGICDTQTLVTFIVVSNLIFPEKLVLFVEFNTRNSHLVESTPCILMHSIFVWKEKLFLGKNELVDLEILPYLWCVLYLRTNSGRVLVLVKGKLPVVNL